MFRMTYFFGSLRGISKTWFRTKPEDPSPARDDGHVKINSQYSSRRWARIGYSDKLKQKGLQKNQVDPKVHFEVSWVYL